MSKGKQNKGQKAKPPVSKAELAKREAQSKRDKAAHAAKLTTPAPRARARRQMTAVTSMGSKFRGDTAGMLLCRQMALPGEVHPPIRLPTQGSDRTAIAVFENAERYNVTALMGNASPYDTPALQGFKITAESADYALMLYGQPSRTYIHGPFLDEEGTYAVNFPASNSYVYTGGTNGADRDVNDFLPIMGITHDSGTPFYGLRRLPMGVGSSGRRYLFMTAGTTLCLAQGHMHPSPYTIEVYEFVDTNQESRVYQYQVPSNATVDAVIFAAPTNGYYAFKILSFVPSDTVRDLTICYKVKKVNTNTRISWHMACVKDLNPTDYDQADPTIGEHMRRTGCAVLISNVANPYKKQGESICARMPNARFSEYTPSAVGAAIEPYFGSAESGAYTYMDFTFEDEAFRDCTERTANGWFASYDLRGTNRVHVVTLQGLYSQTTLAVKLHISVEWLNTTQRYGNAAPSLSYFDLLEARRINNSTDYFYENPIHIEDIMRWIRKGWGLARQYATPIATGVSAAFPSAAPIAMPLGRLLQA